MLSGKGYPRVFGKEPFFFQHRHQDFTGDDLLLGIGSGGRHRHRQAEFGQNRQMAMVHSGVAALAQGFDAVFSEGIGFHAVPAQPVTYRGVRVRGHHFHLVRNLCHLIGRFL